MTRKKTMKQLEAAASDEPVRRLREDAESQSPGATGVVARSADGRLFFIPDEQASSLEIQSSKLYEAYVNTSQQLVAARRADPCAKAKRWLDTHSPNSSLWRQRCLTYFEVC